MDGEEVEEEPTKRDRKAEKANETAFIVANKVGVSGTTMERALRVQSAAPSSAFSAAAACTRWKS